EHQEVHGSGEAFCSCREPRRCRVSGLPPGEHDPRSHPQGRPRQAWRGGWAGEAVGGYRGYRGPDCRPGSCFQQSLGTLRNGRLITRGIFTVLLLLALWQAGIPESLASASKTSYEKFILA